MTNIHRGIIEQYSYKNLYKIELFNTGYVIVFRKTHDGSTGPNSFIGRERTPEDEGYSVVLKITNFSQHYDTPFLDSIIDLLEKFIQLSKVPIPSKTEPISIAYQETYDQFVFDLMNNNNYSDMKKWCLFSSILQEAPSFTVDERRHSLLNILESQIDPESISQWDDLQQSANYIYPTFPYNGKIFLIEKEGQLIQSNRKINNFLMFKNIQQYIEYINIVNLLKNKNCQTLGEAKNLGFINCANYLNKEDIEVASFYLSKLPIFKELPDITLSNLCDITQAFTGVSIGDKELYLFAIHQTLTKDLQESIDKQQYNKGLFLPYEQYLEFERITDKSLDGSPILNNTLPKVSSIPVYADNLLWNFWMTMVKLFSENDVETFEYFFNDWIELIEEEGSKYDFRHNSKSNLLLRKETIQKYFFFMKEDCISVKYLWYIHNSQDEKV